MTTTTTFVTDRASMDEVVAPLLAEGGVEGVVVALITPAGVETAGYGRMGGDAGDRTPDGRTLFEIGSVSKTFTALLLADAVQSGRLEPGTPLADLLPTTDELPGTGGVAVTLEHLATHTSGLPRLPSNLVPADPAQPYADYGPEQALAFLAEYDLPRSPGESYEYSNLAAGLLGWVLTLREQSSWGELVTTRIAGPLGMIDTTVALTDEQRARFAQPHDADGKQVAPWAFDLLAGCGALRSTADDLARYVQAQLGQIETPLQQAMRSTQQPLASTGDQGQVGLGWHIGSEGGLIWHNGGTAGSHSFVGFEPAVGIGVVVLANTAAPAVDQAAMALLKMMQGAE